MTTRHPLDRPHWPPARTIAVGLARIGVALKAQAWRGAQSGGLTPTQGQILALLAARAPRPLTLQQVADGLAVSAATASDAVEALSRKRLTRKARARGDERVLQLTLTASGARAASRAAGWSDFLLAGVEALDDHEQAVFLRGVLKIIRMLQLRGQIPVARACVTCRYFRPNVHPAARDPHHCDFVDAAFGDQQLRLECAEHDEVPPDRQAALWAAFLSPVPASSAGRASLPAATDSTP